MLECPFILPGKISQVLPNVDPPLLASYTSMQHDLTPPGYKQL